MLSINITGKPLRSHLKKNHFNNNKWIISPSRSFSKKAKSKMLWINLLDHLDLLPECRCRTAALRCRSLSQRCNSQHCWLLTDRLKKSPEIERLLWSNVERRWSAGLLAAWKINKETWSKNDYVFSSSMGLMDYIDSICFLVKGNQSCSAQLLFFLVHELMMA